MYLFKLRRVKWGQSPIRTRLTRRPHGPEDLFGVWDLEWIVFDVQVLRQFNNTEVFVHSLFRVQLRSVSDHQTQNVRIFVFEKIVTYGLISHNSVNQRVMFTGMFLTRTIIVTI